MIALCLRVQAEPFKIFVAGRGSSPRSVTPSEKEISHGRVGSKRAELISRWDHGPHGLVRRQEINRVDLENKTGLSGSRRKDREQ